MELKAELALRRQADEALNHALNDPARAAIARIALQMIIDGKTESEVRAEVGEKFHKPKVDLAEQRRVAIQINFRMRGFEISVPKPNVSNTMLKRWRREGRELFYRPATALVSYEAWMTAHGQANHWTVVSKADRVNMSWKNAETGYWFTAEITPACPRCGTSWNDLTAAVRLLYLEEYVVVYWTHRDLTDVCIDDINTLCWLSTHLGQYVLNADSNIGGVGVGASNNANLTFGFDVAGGRAVEVVANAA